MRPRPRSIGKGLLITGMALFAVWWVKLRQKGGTFPYKRRFILKMPRPMISPARLRRVLDPRPGERILEIGPGLGAHATAIAQWVGRTGTAEILDVQQEFLDHTMRAAARRGIENINATCGDAATLPYADGSIDAAVLIACLGEFPDEAGALRELVRVLRPGGRLVVGESLPDPDFITYRTLAETVAPSGLRPDGHRGVPGGYLARFSKAADLDRATAGASGRLPTAR